MSDNLIKVENVSKKFCRSLKRSLWYGVKDLGSELIGRNNSHKSLRKDEFWALQDVSFELKRGDTLGIIGRNGAGKTTLLRMLNGLIKPDAGRIEIKGRMQALIALGAGFNPILTGRENVYVNASVLGIPKSEVDRRFDEIVDFSGIEEFIDTPVQSYSSGMVVRLGFAVAAHMEPDILLVDEILAVGDLSFALKCHRKLSEFRRSGGTVVFVSHSLQAIKNISKEVLWLGHGQIKEIGEVHHVCSLYETDIVIHDKSGSEELGSWYNYDPAVNISKVAFLDNKNRVCTNYEVGGYFKLRIHFNCLRPINSPIFVVNIYSNPEGLNICSNYSSFDGYELKTISGVGYIDFCIDKLPFRPSKYLCSVCLSEEEIANVLDWHEKRHSFSVAGGSSNYGLVHPFPQWSLNHNEMRQ